jgi:hypothetical protein
MVDGNLIRLAEHVRTVSRREQALRREIGRLEAKVAGGHENLIQLLERRRDELATLAGEPDRRTAA